MDACDQQSPGLKAGNKRKVSAQAAAAVAGMLQLCAALRVHCNVHSVAGSVICSRAGG